MRIETLLSPGILSMGVRLRTEAARAISAAEIISGRTPGGKTQTAAQLAAFFTDCASKLSTLIDAVLPTVTARVATSATVLTVTFSEAMDQTVLPVKSTVVITGKTVTSIAWVDSTHLAVTCSGGGLAAGNTITYTPPTTSYLRDVAGNKLATFTGVSA